VFSGRPGRFFPDSGKLFRKLGKGRPQVGKVFPKLGSGLPWKGKALPEALEWFSRGKGMVFPGLE